MGTFVHHVIKITIKMPEYIRTHRMVIHQIFLTSGIFLRWLLVQNTIASLDLCLKSGDNQLITCWSRDIFCSNINRFVLSNFYFLTAKVSSMLNIAKHSNLLNGIKSRLNLCVYPMVLSRIPMSLSDSMANTTRRKIPMIFPHSLGWLWYLEGLLFALWSNLMTFKTLRVRYP